jgi:hypothetical protein
MHVSQTTTGRTKDQADVATRRAIIASIIVGALILADIWTGRHRDSGASSCEDELVRGGRQ